MSKKLKPCPTCGCVEGYWDKLPHNTWLKYPENKPKAGKPILILFDLDTDRYRTEGHYNGGNFYDWCGDEMENILAYKDIEPYNPEE